MLDGKVVLVTGGAGHLGSAISRGVMTARGKAVAVGRTTGPSWSVKAGFHYYSCDVNRHLPDAVAYIEDTFDGLDSLVNIVGDIQTCMEAVEGHVTNVVNIGSLWSDLSPNPAMYLDLGNCPTPEIVGSKGSITALTRYYAGMWAPKVRVNCVTPGWFPKKRGPDRPDYIEQITSRTPLGRIGVPDDIVGTVLFLLSDASRFMTGQNLVVDGGYSIW